MGLALGLILFLVGCSQSGDQPSSPAQVSAPALTAQQEKVAAEGRSELMQAQPIASKAPAQSAAAPEKGKDCNWGVASEIACPVHPEKPNSSK